MSNISISEANINDLNTIFELTKEAYTKQYKPGLVTTVVNDHLDRLVEEFVSDHMTIFKATVGQLIVGAIRCRVTNDDLYIFRLAVSENYRNQGIAKLLIDQAEVLKNNLGLKKLRLECSQEKGLVPLYEKYGFVVDEVHPLEKYHKVYMSKE